MKNKILFILVVICTMANAQKKDLANFKFYHDQNSALKDQLPMRDHVVFMGNSITQFWKDKHPEFFKDNLYVDRGISGQTSSQMLLRFRRDVIDLKPKAVVILAGINDIAQNTGPITVENIFGNIVSMVELAQANDIQVILCSVLPASKFPWESTINPIEKIIQLNNLISTYAETHNLPYVNYYEAMVMKDKAINPVYANDGVHPNREGYLVMEPLVNAEIEKLSAN
ncbi:GDSL-type esterase/lipase family protein [Mesonia aestuariivivens]|uniref:Acylhydrolase n=1 Tax=Mesonia aestuariivivens TaxID=2796128 RepID=A0ABS6W5V3_9FLAO|nr:GDSL-type esterase/lipase family protein [Mesonia aestuariivivens]MBW2962504.1 acylhydrolase [Mesonia aestuariivivens]